MPKSTLRSRTRRNVIVRTHDAPAAPTKPRTSARRKTTLPTAQPVAPPPKRRTGGTRARTAALGSLEPGREGVAAALANTDVRGPSTGGRAARERSKIASIRDGRYGRTRSRFIV